MEDLKKLLVQNSLNETDSSDIEKYDDFIDKVISDNIRGFIGYDIADVQPLNQPVGKIFARSSRLDKFEIVSKSVVAQTSKHRAEISAEAVEDLKALSGDLNLFSNFIVSKTKREESLKLVKYINDNAIAVDNLTLNQEAKDNHETGLFYLNKKINKEIAKMNKDNYKTYDAVCILPHDKASEVLGMSFTYSRSVNVLDEETKARDFYLGTINNTKYFINPDTNATDILLLLHSKNDKGVSGLIYSPYNIIVSSTKDPETAATIYNIFVKDGWTVNPMHTPNSPFIVKFKIV